MTVRVPSVRGEIRDRNGIPLATNHSSYEVDFYLPEIVNAYTQERRELPRMEVLTRDRHGMLHHRDMADIVKIVEQDIIPGLRARGLAVPYDAAKLHSHFLNNLYVPFVYRDDLDFTTFTKFAEQNLGLRGVQIRIRSVRQYNYGALAAQILGYVFRILSSAILKTRPINYLRIKDNGRCLGRRRMQQLSFCPSWTTARTAATFERDDNLRVLFVNRWSAAAHSSF